MTEKSSLVDAVSLQAALTAFSLPFSSVEEIGAAMRELIDAGLTELPLPAGGRTLERWRALALIGGCDLSLAKVYEGHTDAIAISAELQAPQPKGLSAVWAAEKPDQRVVFTPDGEGGTVSGQKSWCSGVAVVDEAILSAWTPDGQSILIQISLRQPGIEVETAGWQAVGMAASQSGSVSFKNARARMVGAAGDYVTRPGFWQGGAGIAAVWYGAAVEIARTLEKSPRLGSDPFLAAHLGAIDVVLRSTKPLLQETAAWIDAHPAADASAAALRLRASVEAAATEVLARTGRALGPAPLCANAVHARRCADLPVFLRQNHAEHDLAALGRSLAGDSSAWNF